MPESNPDPRQIHVQMCVYLLFVLLLHIFKLEQTMQLPFCFVFSSGGERGLEELRLGFVCDKTERALPRDPHDRQEESNGSTCIS